MKKTVLSVLMMAKMGMSKQYYIKSLEWTCVVRWQTPLLKGLNSMVTSQMRNKIT